MATFNLTSCYFCLLAICQLIFVNFVNSSSEDLGYKEILMQCGDNECKEIISTAYTLGHYPSRNSKILSFKLNEKVNIYGKPLYLQPKMAYGEIRGRKGLIPMNLIREDKVLNRNFVQVAYRIAPDVATASIKEKLPNNQTDAVEVGASGNLQNDRSTANAVPVENSIDEKLSRDLESSEPKVDNSVKTVPEAKDRLVNHITQNHPPQNVETSIASDSMDEKLQEKNQSDIVNFSASEDPQKDRSTANIAKVEASIDEKSSQDSESNKLKADNTVKNVPESTDGLDVAQSQASQSVATNYSSESVEEKFSKNNQSNTAEVGASENPQKDKLTTNTVPVENITDAKLSHDSESSERKVDTTLENVPKSTNGLADLHLTQNQTSQNVGTSNASEFIDEKLPTNNQSDIVIPGALENPQKDTSTANTANLEPSIEENSSQESESNKPEANITVENVHKSMDELEITHNEPSQNVATNNSSESVEAKLPKNNQSDAAEVGASVNHQKDRSTANTVPVDDSADEKLSHDSESSEHDVNNNEVNASQTTNGLTDFHLTQNQSSLSVGASNASQSIEAKSHNYHSDTVEPGTSETAQEDASMAKTMPGEPSNNEQLSHDSESNEPKVHNTVDNVSQSTGGVADFHPTGNQPSQSVETSNPSFPNLAHKENVGEGFAEKDEGKSGENLVNTLPVYLPNEDSSSVDDFPLPNPDAADTVVKEPYDSISNDADGDFISQNASVVFSVIPKEYVEILRIYVTLLTDMLPDDVKIALYKLRISSHVVVFSVLWGFLWISMYFIGVVAQSFLKDNSLKSQLCDYQVKFFKLKIERDALRKELKQEESKRYEMEEKIYERDHKIAVLDKEVNKLKIERDELQEKVHTLESDVQRATDAGLELNQILSDFLTSQKENINLNAKMDTLQDQIASKDQSIAQLRHNCQLLEDENSELKQSVEKNSSEVERLTRILNEMETNLKTFQSNNELLKVSKNEAVLQVKKLEEEKDKLSQQMESLKLAQRSLETCKEDLIAKVTNLEVEVDVKNNELESLKNIVKTLQLEGDENCMNDIYDIAKMETKLRILEKEKTEMESKLERITIEQKTLLDKVKSLEEIADKCRDTESKAVMEKNEAQNKLEILTTYFKKREVELQSEIGKLQVTKEKTLEDASSLATRMQLMEEENEAYKSQVESMKKEYAESERNWKAQLAVMEKQAHENWVAVRKAEREITFLKNNSTMWRQHLAAKAQSSGETSPHLDEDSIGIPEFAPPPPPLLNSFSNMSFDENSEDRQWDPNSNALPPPPPMPPFGGVDFSNMSIPPPPFPPMTSHHQPMPFVGNHQLHWDSPASRDTFSPVSHESHDRRSSRGHSPSQSLSSAPYGRGAMPNPVYSHPGNMPNQGLTSNPVHTQWSRVNGSQGSTTFNNKNAHDNRKTSRSDSRNSYSTGSLHHASNV